MSEGLIKEGSIFSPSYITYKLTTLPFSYEVRRKDADFQFLRKILLRQFPHLIIPPCPPKAQKLTPKFVKKREIYYTRFLQAIARCEELKACQFLECFLAEQDVKSFQKAMKEADKAKYGRSVEEFVTYKGQAKVQMTSNSSAFCTKMLDYAESYQILYKEVIDCAKEIKDKSLELATTMRQMQRFIEQMSELNRMIKCTSQHETFAWLAQSLESSAVFISKQGELVEKYVGTDLKYHYDEGESFKELFALREQVKFQYVKQERQVAERKERLFKTRDVFKWGGFQDHIELLRLKDELLKPENKDIAFEYMLPRETQEVEGKREELSFFTN